MIVFTSQQLLNTRELEEQFVDQVVSRDKRDWRVRVSWYDELMQSSIREQRNAVGHGGAASISFRFSEAQSVQYTMLIQEYCVHFDHKHRT